MKLKRVAMIDSMILAIKLRRTISLYALAME